MKIVYPLDDDNATEINANSSEEEYSWMYYKKECRFQEERAEHWLAVATIALSALSGVIMSFIAGVVLRLIS